MSIRRLSTSTLTEQTRYASMRDAGVSSEPFAVSCVVVAGGGGGGLSFAGKGGGGGGGYYSNVSGEKTGDNFDAEIPIYIEPGSILPIYVGAGGAAASLGGSAWFAGITRIGGGYAPSGYGAGERGGSGGGGNGTTTFGSNPGGGAGQTRQGQDGGDGFGSGNSAIRAGGGGGGAITAGTNAGSSVGGVGGTGASSSITGSSVTRASGGDGRSNTSTGSAGGANTGDGGDAGAAGGSGVVIFAVPTGTSVSFSGGVTQTSSTVGLDDVYTVTATSTTLETVTIG